ncbi:hypothetical protein G9C85_02010 [Halorubellus sp. JP-L1]|uniref:hypothetical protein n=1 Tax=Halorubellus sp. JP-L1 TaxID=2715753 RepID=UPI001407DF4B|nr:hypothetical protein [Halorubellus sp. JP-L1]NHN40411.1 hypothetical protein [Halorubellus sp. JP-L1]
MLATNFAASGIAGQLSNDSTAQFTIPMQLVAKALPFGFPRALTADAAVTRSQSTRSGMGDAPYEHR